MYVGLDISKNTVVCVGKDKEGNKLFEGTYLTDKEGLNKLVESINEKDELVVEASTSGVFVYDYLTSRKFAVKVANPQALKLISDSEKKTDRTDAEKLADLLRTNMLPTCYLPDRKIREIRDIVRHRSVLVATNTIFKNKIRAILAREGLSLPYKNVIGKDSVKWLGKAEISIVQKRTISRFVDIALNITSRIEEYDGDIDNEYISSKEAQLLDTIPGISHYSAVHIMSAIGNINRFNSDEQLASYAGLVPRIRQSGDTNYKQGLKHGDRLLKWILVQNAHVAVKYSKKLRKYYLKKRRKNGSQKAIIAVARKMIEIIYCMLTRGEKYNEDYS